MKTAYFQTQVNNANQIKNCHPCGSYQPCGCTNPVSSGGGWVGTATSDLNMDNFAITNSGDITLVNSKVLYLDNNDSLTINYGSSSLGIQNGQAGFAGISIGNHNVPQTQGSSSVSIGSNAGTSQGGASVALGSQAGQTTQGDLTVAVGAGAGQTTQQQGAVAVGRIAGNNNQGDYSIAIGYEAGTNNQADNSIILNATGSALQNITPSSFVVKPIRGVAHGIGVGVLRYDTASGEITYSTT